MSVRQKLAVAAMEFVLYAGLALGLGFFFRAAFVRPTSAPAPLAACARLLAASRTSADTLYVYVNRGDCAR